MSDCPHKKIILMSWNSGAYKAFCADCNADFELSREAFDVWRAEQKRCEKRCSELTQRVVELEAQLDAVKNALEVTK